VAYRDAISPTAVGFDIGCGNKAVCVDMPGSELRGPDKQSVDMRHFESGGWPLSE
jgi:tRNA-splicing ligase RtcB